MTFLIIKERIVTVIFKNLTFLQLTRRTEQVLHHQGLLNHILLLLHLRTPPSDKAWGSCHHNHSGTEQLLFPCVDEDSLTSSPPSPLPLDIYAIRLNVRWRTLFCNWWTISNVSTPWICYYDPQGLSGLQLHQRLSLPLHHTHDRLHLQPILSYHDALGATHNMQQMLYTVGLNMSCPFLVLSETHELSSWRADSNPFHWVVLRTSDSQ